MSKPQPRACANCGKVFTPPRRHEPKFCCKSCVWQVTRGPEFNASIARDPKAREKRSEANRNKGAGKTYRKLLGRHEHRVIAEQMLGRPLKPGEIVHHVDGNLRNNEPSNLKVMTQAEHCREHRLGYRDGPNRWGRLESK